MMALKEEFIRFCKSTSVKGIPRAVNSPQPYIRITWLLAVAGFIVIGIFQTFSVMNEFLSYPTFVFTREETLDDTTHKPKLPSLTLCNENPLTSLYEIPAGIPTIQQYYATVDAVTSCDGCDAEATAAAELSRRNRMLSASAARPSTNVPKWM